MPTGWYCSASIIRRHRSASRAARAVVPNNMLALRRASNSTRTPPMKARILSLLGAAALAACSDPVAQQAGRDTRHDPVRADDMLAVNFAPGTGRLDQAQANELRAMVTAGRAAQRDEFIVVTSGTGGAMQNLRAQQVRASLSAAGARWVSTSVEPAMAMGPDQV